MKQTVWDNQAGQAIPIPSEMDAFLTDLDAVFRKHQMILGKDAFEDIVVRHLYEGETKCAGHLLIPCKDYGPQLDFSQLAEVRAVRRAYICYDELVYLELDCELSEADQDQLQWLSNLPVTTVVISEAEEPNTAPKGGRLVYTRHTKCPVRKKAASARIHKAPKGSCDCSDGVKEVTELPSQSFPLYQTIIRLKRNIAPAKLQEITSIISRLFDNRAGKVRNSSSDPYLLVFAGDERDWACLDLGTLALEDVPSLIDYISDCQWIDKDPNESCDVLETFKVEIR